MRIKPTDNFHTLGTDIWLNTETVYDAEPATNQPDYEKRGAIFVLCGPGEDAFLLESGEYTILPDLPDALDGRYFTQTKSHKELTDLYGK